MRVHLIYANLIVTYAVMTDASVVQEFSYYITGTAWTFKKLNTKEKIKVSNFFEQKNWKNMRSPFSKVQETTDLC